MTSITSLSEDVREAVLVAELPEDGGERLTHCLVCYSDLEYTTITPCHHNEICGVCHLRIRHLHGDRKCPICKKENDLVVVDRPDVKQFQEYPIWGDSLGAEFTFHKEVGMFFPTEYYEKDIQPLFGYHCTLPNCQYDGMTPDPNVYDKANANANKKDDAQQQEQQQQPQSQKKTPIRALQDHLRNKHRLTLCNLCVDHQRDFVSRLPRFTPGQLKRHLQDGDGALSGFAGHPMCEFCKPTRFYDLTQLHGHLQKEHYKCHVCEKMGLVRIFFFFESRPVLLSLPVQWRARCFRSHIQLARKAFRLTLRYCVN